MAFRDAAKDFADKLPKQKDNLFYNTDGFVGPANAPGLHRGSRNRPDDVMLVQHFLRVVALNPSKFQNPFHPPKKFPTMKVDGLYGDITSAWIVAFQNHLKNIGRPVFGGKPDERPVGAAESTRSSTRLSSTAPSCRPTASSGRLVMRQPSSRWAPVQT